MCSCIGVGRRQVVIQAEPMLFPQCLRGGVEWSVLTHSGRHMASRRVLTGELMVMKMTMVWMVVAMVMVALGAII